MTNEPPKHKSLLSQLKTCMEQLEEKQKAENRRIKPPTLLAIPRHLARPLIMEYAAETGLVLGSSYEDCLSNETHSPEILLVVWGVPVLCIQMQHGVDMVGAWTWPPYEALREVEESPKYPGLPWRSGMESSPEDMMIWCHKARVQATQLTQEHPFPIHWLPLEVPA